MRKAGAFAMLTAILLLSVACSRPTVVMPVIDVKVQPLRSVESASWDVGEQKLCSTRPSAITPGTGQQILLCSDAESTWEMATDPELNSFEPVSKAHKAELEAMLHAVKYLPVLKGKADHVMHIKGREAVTVWECTKGPSGTLSCN